ncbi:MAG TPA: ABC transporter ATP-binding protein [Hyphomicrobiales bacterium]|nr:ABC transporter ATP-binding protein [Hyphomicrobiales bacterium]
MSDDSILLRTEALTKSFGGFVAVQGVSLDIRRGSIHALIGPNGAGKTTYFNLLTRFLPATSGRILYKGTDITATTPHQVACMGIVRSFQISAVFPHLTVLENVRVALQRRRGGNFAFWRSDSVLSELDDRARALLADVGLEAQAGLIAADLPYGRKRALEVATTLALDPELLLLDEPTSGMAHEDVGRIVELVRRVAKNRTVLMVEHNLSVVADLSDRITVLNRGQILADGTYAEVSKNPAVVEAYVGTAHG